ncbi:MAG: phosphodiester glycosidase family protein [Thermodesulfobacteriota bacterium]
MNWRIPLLSLVMVAFWLLLFPLSILPQDELWKRIDDGLSLSEIHSQRLTLIKIDPAYYSFKLLCASENGKLRMTAKRWCQKHNIVSAINAGMFQADGMTNVGYMKNFNHINNPRLNTRYKAVLAFNPVDATVPEIQIIDLKCQDFERLKEKYQTLIQGIRMVSCRQENVWEKQDKMWSIAAFGIDKNGNGLFIFTESPFSVHDFTNILLSLPLSLYNAVYLEGGPEATLYFSGKGVEFEKVGSHETGLNENDFPKIARPIPNIIGIVKKSR